MTRSVPDADRPGPVRRQMGPRAAFRHSARESATTRVGTANNRAEGPQDRLGRRTSVPRSTSSLATLRLGRRLRARHRELHERRRHGSRAKRRGDSVAAAGDRLRPRAKRRGREAVRDDVPMSTSTGRSSGLRRSATASTRSTIPISKTATAFHKGQYASVNLLWHPPSGVFTGGELLWGKRTDNDGNTGTDLRFQYSFHWDFSSKNIWSLFD